jgi:hypothetical protein
MERYNVSFQEAEQIRRAGSFETVTRGMTPQEKINYYKKHNIEYTTVTDLPAQVIQPQYEGDIVVPEQPQTWVSKTTKVIKKAISPPKTISLGGISFGPTVEEAITTGAAIAVKTGKPYWEKAEPYVKTYVKKEIPTTTFLTASLIKKGWEKLPTTGFVPVPIEEKHVEAAKGSYTTPYLGEFGGTQWAAADVTQLVEGKQEDISAKQETVRKYLDYKYKLDYQKGFDKETQYRFDKKYSTDIATGKITFEEAVKEFQESKDYKKLQEKYAAIRGIELAEKMSWWQKQIFGTYSLGLGLQSSVLGAVKSPKEMVKTSLKVGAVGGVLYATGPAVSAVAGKTGTGILKWGVPTVGAAYGALTSFDPTSSPEKSAMGTAILALSVGTLAHHGIRYARQPFVKYKKIPIKKATLKAEQNIGKSRMLEGRGGVAYPKQKLYQTAVPGRRTVVTSRWSTWFSKQPYGSGAIYRGVPTKDPLGYQKAFKRLTSYGWTAPQAKQTLRFFAPRYIEKYQLGQALFIEDGKMKGYAVFETRQPKITISKRLGITTRGAKTLRQYSYVERRLTATPKGVSYALEGRINLKELKRIPSNLRAQGMTRGFNVNFERSRIKAYSTRPRNYYRDLGFESKYGEFKVKSIHKFKQITSFTRTEDIFSGKKTFRFGDRTTLFQETPIGTTRVKVLTPANIVKTPLGKTFGWDKLIKPTVPAPVPTPTPTLGGGTTTTGGSETITITTTQAELQTPITAPALTSASIPKAIGVTSPSIAGALLSEQSIIGASLLKPDSGMILKASISPALGIKSSSATGTTTITPQKTTTIVKTIVDTPIINIPVVTPPTPPPPPPASPIITPPPISPILEKTKEKKPSLMAEFRAFARRFGADKEIGLFKTKEEAKEKLFKRLRTTLAASGYITKGSGKGQRKLKVSELGGLKAGFRPSKIDVFRVVEKKPKRLKKGTWETEEIKLFKKGRRKSKRRKRKKKNLFGL